MPHAPADPDLPERRRLLRQGAALIWAPAWLFPWGAQAQPPRADSPLVGVDPVLVQSGLTRQWEGAMRRDLGWAAQWAPQESAQVLSQLEQGQVDLGLFLTHPLADRLARDGLIHGRQSLARTGICLVGPQADKAGIRGETDPARALSQVLAAHAAGAARWTPPPEGSALRAWADALTAGAVTRAAQTPRPGGAAPAATDAGSALAEPAYRLITQAQWRPPGAPGRKDRTAAPAGGAERIWLSPQPRMHLDCEMARAFRTRHPGTQLLMKWLQGPLAQRAVRDPGSGWAPVPVSPGKDGA